MKRISATTPDETAAAYHEWRKRFEKRSDARIALNSLERELSALNPERFPDLREQVLAACFNAYRLQSLPEKDDYELWRRQAKRLGSRDDEIFKAIKTIRKALTDNPLIMSMAITIGRLKRDAMPPLAGDRMEYAEKLSEVLLALERGIKLVLQNDNSSPSILNRIGGCLEYPAEFHLNASKPNHAINSLTFELALLFKLWDTKHTTALPCPSYWQDEGQPRYRLVAEFVNVALEIDGQEFSERKAMDRIRDLRANHPGIYYIGWGPVGTPKK